jgi:hypothetical protein
MPDIEGRVAAARDDVDRAEDALYEAEARAWVTHAPGLWYAPDRVDQSRYVVGYDGELVGYLWPARPGQLLAGWMAARAVDAEDRLGPFPTGRAAAAALIEPTR